jgi:hypothetical protein
MMLGLAACAAPAPVARAPQPALLDPDAICLRDLERDHVVFEPAREYSVAGSCGVPNPVRVSAAGAQWSSPGVVSCQMARQIDRFELDVVQPLAQKFFGQPVVRLNHMGTYNCRNQRNSAVASAKKGRTGGRLSEHAKGQAIDIGGFQLADGSVISVKTHWTGAGRKSEFLHEVAQASCDTFNVVLTPNHNREHHDHLHLDIGPHKLCGY